MKIKTWPSSAARSWRNKIGNKIGDSPALRRQVLVGHEQLDLGQRAHVDHQAVGVVGSHALEALHEPVPDVGLGRRFSEGQVEFCRDEQGLPVVGLEDLADRPLRAAGIP